jgi:hypothetical protein
MGNGSPSRGKSARRGVNYPTPSNGEVKERVELYLYTPSWLSWPVQGEIFEEYLYGRGHHILHGFRLFDSLTFFHEA